MNERIATKAWADSTFVQTLTHDLRQPLRHIMLLTQRLQQSGGGGGPELEHTLNGILAAARLQEELIGAVLEYDLAICHGIGTETLIPLRIVIQSACDRLDGFRSTHGGTLTFDGSAAPQVRVPTGIGKAIECVLHNALKFHARDAVPEVSVDARIDAGEQVEIRVSDHGVGIEPRYRQSVTRAFSRLHPSSEYQGNGLGLSICEALLASIGGSLTIDDTAYGEGIAVTLRFPLVFGEA